MTHKWIKMTAPCSCLDIEKFQSWLEDLSEQGYLLHKPGAFRHTYLFHRISPLKTRYRLTPVSDHFEDWNERPDAEKQSLAEAFGWEYVGSVGGLHIYRSYNDEDRELHSDPHVLAESLRLLKNKALFSAFALPLSLVLYWLIITVLAGPGQLWRHLIRDGIVLYASFALLFLFATCKGIYRLTKLIKLYQLLHGQKLPIHHQDWKKGEMTFRLRTGFTYAIGMLMILSFSLSRMYTQDSLRLQDHPNDGGSLPFLTILDLAERSGSQSADRLEAGGMISWTQPFSDTNYQWTEIVDVVSKDGLKGRFSMELFYHEMHSDWLADRLTNEILREAKSSGTPAEPAPAAGADLAYFYTDHRGCPAAVIRSDNTVIQIRFVRMDFEDANLNLNAWIEGTVNAR